MLTDLYHITVWSVWDSPGRVVTGASSPSRYSKQMKILIGDSYSDLTVLLVALSCAIIPYAFHQIIQTSEAVK